MIIMIKKEGGYIDALRKTNLTIRRVYGIPLKSASTATERKIKS